MLEGNQMQVDKLNEIARQSATKAASALSKLLESQISIDIVPVQIKRLSEIRAMMHSQAKVIGSFVPLTGSVSGASFLIYNEDSALAVCDALLHRTEGSTKLFSQTEMSALSELANIIVGNFLTAFAVPLKIDKLMHRAPDFNYDEFSNFFDSALASLPSDIKEGLIVNVGFHFKHVKISGMAVFLFNEREINEVFEKLRVTQ